MAPVALVGNLSIVMFWIAVYLLVALGVSGVLLTILRQSQVENFVQEQVGSGEYASASEVVRDALRPLEGRKQYRQAKLDLLRAEIQKGLASPAEDVFAAVRARIAQVAKEKAGN